MLILTNLSGWLSMIFSPNLCIKKYITEKKHTQSCKKRNMKTIAFSSVPGGIFVMDRSGHCK